MSFTKAISLGLSMVIITSGGYAATNESKTMTYKNQRGSTLVLSFQKIKGNTGSLTGMFTTLVGNCQENIGVPMPVTGYFNDNAIALSINFPECKQVISMTGYLTENKNQLQTTWLDAFVVIDPYKKDWNSISTGTDFYKKI